MISKATTPEPGWEREPPRPVRQESQRTCWAAALVAWMQATGKRHWHIQSEKTAISYFSHGVNDAGSLTVKGDAIRNKQGDALMRLPSGVEWVADEFGMGLKVHNRSQRVAGWFLYQKLKQHGHLYFLFARGAIGHAAVVYKVSRPWTEDCALGMMDPWVNGDGSHVGLIERPLSYFFGDEVIVGWPR